MTALPHLWVDADSCPYKEEIIAIGKKNKLEISFVSNSEIKSLQGRKGIYNKVTERDFDAVDDYIVAESKPKDIVVTKDLILAKRLIEQQVQVCGLLGKAYTPDQLADAMAHRNLHQMLRDEQGGFNSAGSKKQVSKKDKAAKFKNHFHNFLEAALKSF